MIPVVILEAHELRFCSDDILWSPYLGSPAYLWRSGFLLRLVGLRLETLNLAFPVHRSHLGRNAFEGLLRLDQLPIGGIEQSGRLCGHHASAFVDGGFQR